MKKDLDRIESELIEQEHRPIKVISNYLNRKNLWPEDEKKQNSARKAILWRLFFSPGVVAVVGGGVALCSLIVLIWQNGILVNQNVLIRNQNLWFQQQIISGELNSLKEQLYKAELKPNIMAQVLEDYISTKRELNLINMELDSSKRRSVEIRIRGISLKGLSFDNEKDIFSDVVFEEVDFRGSHFTDIDFKGTTFINCNFNLIVEGIGSSKFGSDSIAFRPTIFQNCKIFQSNLASTNQGLGALFIDTSFEANFELDEIEFHHSTYLNCLIGGKKPISFAKSINKTIDSIPRDLLYPYNYITEGYRESYEGLQKMKLAYFQVAREYAEFIKNNERRLKRYDRNRPVINNVRIFQEQFDKREIMGARLIFRKSNSYTQNLNFYYWNIDAASIYEGQRKVLAKIFPEVTHR